MEETDFSPLKAEIDEAKRKFTRSIPDGYYARFDDSRTFSDAYGTLSKWTTNPDGARTAAALHWNQRRRLSSPPRLGSGFYLYEVEELKDPSADVALALMRVRLETPEDFAEAAPRDPDSDPVSEVGTAMKRLVDSEFRGKIAHRFDYRSENFLKGFLSVVDRFASSKASVGTEPAPDFERLPAAARVRSECL